MLLFLTFVSFCEIPLPAADWTRMGWVQRSGYNPGLPTVNKEEPANTSPWRTIAGETNNIFIASNWFTIFGHVSQVFKDGLLLDASFGGEMRKVILRNYPKNMVDGDRFELYPRAKYVGEESYTTAIGAKATVRVFDYGTPCAAPAPHALTPGEIAARNARVEQAKAVAAEKALAWHQAQAAQGTPYGLLEMGKRHLAGDGVEKDLTKAREYFQKAALQGSPDATNLLEKLTPQ